MPTKTLLKSYASGTTTADAVVAAVVPKSGRLVGVIANIALTVSASAGENGRFEISLQSASQFTQTDASNVIGYIGASAPAATAGISVHPTFNLLGMDIPVEAGSKLYVHRSVSTAPASLLLNITWIIA